MPRFPKTVSDRADAKRSESDSAAKSAVHTNSEEDREAKRGKSKYDVFMDSLSGIGSGVPTKSGVFAKKMSGGSTGTRPKKRSRVARQQTQFESSAFASGGSFAGIFGADNRADSEEEDYEDEEDEEEASAAATDESNSPHDGAVRAGQKRKIGSLRLAKAAETLSKEIWDDAEEGVYGSALPAASKAQAAGLQSSSSGMASSSAPSGSLTSRTKPTPSRRKAAALEELRMEREEHRRSAIASAPNVAYAARSSVPDPGTILELTMHDFMCHRHLKIDFGRFVTFIVGRNGSGKSAVSLALRLLVDRTTALLRTSQNKHVQVRRRDAAADRCYVEMAISNKKSRQGGTTLPFNHDYYGDWIRVQRRIGVTSTKWPGFLIWGEKQAHFMQRMTYNSADGVLRGKDAETELESLVRYFQYQPDNPVVFLTQERAKQLAMSSSRHKYELFLAATEARKSIDTLHVMRRRMSRTSDDLVALQAVRVRLQKQAAAARAEWNKCRQVRDASSEIPRLRLHIATAEQAEATQRKARLEQKLENDRGRLRLQRDRMVDLVQHADRLDEKAAEVDTQAEEILMGIAQSEARGTALRSKISKFESKRERLREAMQQRKQEAAGVLGRLRAAQEEYDEAWVKAGIPPVEDSSDESTDVGGDTSDDELQLSDGEDEDEGATSGGRGVSGKSGAKTKRKRGRPADKRVKLWKATFDRSSPAFGMRGRGKDGSSGAKGSSSSSDDDSDEEFGMRSERRIGTDLPSTIIALEAKEAAGHRKVRRLDAMQRRLAAFRREVSMDFSAAELELASRRQLLGKTKKVVTEAKQRLKQVQQAVDNERKMGKRGIGRAEQEARAARDHITVASMMLGSAAGRFCAALCRSIPDDTPVGPVCALLRLRPEYQKWGRAVGVAIQDILPAFRCSSTSQFKQARSMAIRHGFNADLRAFRALDAAGIEKKCREEGPSLDADGSIADGSSSSGGASGHRHAPVRLPFLVSSAIAVRADAGEDESRCVLHALHSFGKAHCVAVVQSPEQARELLGKHPKLLRCVLADGSGVIGRSGRVVAAASAATGQEAAGGGGGGGSVRGGSKRKLASSASSTLSSSSSSASAVVSSGMFLRPVQPSQMHRIVVQSLDGTESVLKPLRDALDASEEAHEDAIRAYDAVKRDMAALQKRLDQLDRKKEGISSQGQAIAEGTARYTKQLQALRSSAASDRKNREGLVAAAKAKRGAVEQLRTELDSIRRHIRRLKAQIRDAEEQLAPVQFDLEALLREAGTRRDVLRLERQAHGLRAQADEERTEARTIKMEYERIYSRRQKRKVELAEKRIMVEKGREVIELGWKELLGDDYDPDGKDERQQAPLGMEEGEPITKERLQERLRTLEALQHEARLRADAARRLAKGKAPAKRSTDDVLRSYQRAQKKLEVNEQQISIATSMHRGSLHALEKRHRNMLRLVEDAQAQVKLQFRKITRHFPFKRAELVWEPDDADDPTRCGCLHINVVPFASDRATDGDGEDDGEKEMPGSTRLLDDGTGRVDARTDRAGGGAGPVDYRDEESDDDDDDGRRAPPRVPQDSVIGVTKTARGMRVLQRRLLNGDTVLSGGEKSAVSVGLCLALAGQVETPVRLLDEFDVFQDEPSRRLSMAVLLEGAFLAACNGRINGHQTILLTPHDVSSAPSHVYPSDFVRTFRMPEPKRVAAGGAAGGGGGGGGGGAAGGAGGLPEEEEDEEEEM